MTLDKLNRYEEIMVSLPMKRPIYPPEFPMAAWKSMAFTIVISLKCIGNKMLTEKRSAPHSSVSCSSKVKEMVAALVQDIV